MHVYLYVHGQRLSSRPADPEPEPEWSRYIPMKLEGKSRIRMESVCVALILGAVLFAQSSLSTEVVCTEGVMRFAPVVSVSSMSAAAETPGYVRATTSPGTDLFGDLRSRPWLTERHQAGEPDRIRCSRYDGAGIQNTSGPAAPHAFVAFAVGKHRHSRVGLVVPQASFETHDKTQSVLGGSSSERGYVLWPPENAIHAVTLTDALHTRAPEQHEHIEPQLLFTTLTDAAAADG